VFIWRTDYGKPTVANWHMANWCKAKGRIPRWLYVITHSDWYGSKIFDLGWLGSGQLSMVWVWVRKISPKNVKIFNLFPFRSKKIFSAALVHPITTSERVRVEQPNFLSFSLQIKKISSGQVKRYAGQRAGQPLIYWGPKVSSGRFGSGPISHHTY